MKILLSAYACQPNQGSEPGIGWNWAIHLAKRGCDVHVLTAGRNRRPIEEYLRSHSVPHLQFHYVDVPWLDPSQGNRKYYLLWLYFASRKAKSLLSLTQFDLVHHVSYGAIQIPPPYWQLGIPVIFGPAGGAQTAPPSLIPYLQRKGILERTRSLAIRVLSHISLYRAQMRRMNVVLAANAETALHAKRVGCRRVELFCDTGLRDDYASPSPRNFSPASPIRLLWVGRFLPRKGLLLALDAVAEAKDSIELSLVGSGLDQTLVWRAVKERHLEGRVHWEGTRLSWQQVRDAYNTHDALLFTSIRDTFGSQNLEAMSVGLPIIYLNLSGAKDFIPAGAGIGAEVGPTLSSTVANLRSAINRFSELTVTERNRMSHVAWTASKAFRWPERADAVYKLYEESCALSTNAVSI